MRTEKLAMCVRCKTNKWEILLYKKSGPITQIIVYNKDMQTPDINQVFRIGVLVIVAGLVLLGLTFLVELFIPLISLAVLIVVIYLVYKYITTGKIQL
jgi:hypothetical protein